MITLSADELREHLSYDPTTGVFSYRKTGFGRRAGQICGSPERGYIRIGVKRTIYYAHRLAWLYVYGEFPSDFIDHINMDRSDNRIENLRIATRAQNSANTGSRGLHGLKGVCWHKAAKRWSAFIKVNQKNIHLGLFDTAEAAHRAYCRAAEQHFGEFARSA